MVSGKIIAGSKPVSVLSTCAAQGWWSHRVASPGGGRGDGQEHMSSARKQHHGHITRPRISGGKSFGTWEEIGEGLATAGTKLLGANSGSRAHLGALGFAVLAGKTRLKAELERERSVAGESAGLRAAAGAKTAGVARLEAQAQGQALHRVGGSQRRRGEHSG